uniref:Uncharacterized protein n=1 Tax=Picea glauca TaxID=3330 RepID=A0A101LW78_PICGL|nr:hypothetical protein ABT39_MTgene1605 [Picea glauca]QHR86546.1 hypothetical protein Q903MT_gene548 [Picea sitchensis]
MSSLMKRYRYSGCFLSALVYLCIIHRGTKPLKGMDPLHTPSSAKWSFMKCVFYSLAVPRWKLLAV